MIVSAPLGSSIGANGVFGRETDDGYSIDIPANGDKPHETLRQTKKATLVIKKFEIELLCSTFPEFRDSVRDKCIAKLLVPINQSLKETWNLNVVFVDGSCFKIRGLTSIIKDWEEIGRLEISRSEMTKENEMKYQRIDMKLFRVDSVKKIVYEDENVLSEVGIILVSKLDGNVLISTAVSPGSVTVSVPSSTDLYSPEPSLEDCRID